MKVGDMVKTNKKYDGKPEEGLKIIEACERVFINHEKTYLLESKSGKRAYYGRSWVCLEEEINLKDLC